MDPYAYVNNNPETFNDPTGQRLISPSGQLGPLTSIVSPDNSQMQGCIPITITLVLPPQVAPVLPNSPQWHHLVHLRMLVILNSGY